MPICRMPKLVAWFASASVKHIHRCATFRNQRWWTADSGIEELEEGVKNVVIGR